MPPKAKFTKEEIVNAALDITKTDGISLLTARALGTKLGSSARPVFTVFKNMEEVQNQVIQAAKNLYREYIKTGLSETPPFRGVGKQYILFAIQEPKLFQLLFMTEQKEVPGLSEILPLIDESYDEILLSVKKSYSLNDALSKQLYQHLWIYTHGIASLCATGMCRFSKEEMEKMMAEVSNGLVKK